MKNWQAGVVGCCAYISHLWTNCTLGQVYMGAIANWMEHERSSGIHYYVCALARNTA